jgi:hypothetical protein
MLGELLEIVGGGPATENNALRLEFDVQIANASPGAGMNATLQFGLQ